MAVTTANTEAVYFLVNKAKANVNGVTGEYNETPLIIAAYYGTKKHKEIADFCYHMVQILMRQIYQEIVQHYLQLYGKII